MNEKRKICHFHLQIRNREAGRLSGCPKFSQEVTGYYGESQENFVLRKSMSTATERSMEGGHFQNCNFVARNPCESNCIILCACRIRDIDLRAFTVSPILYCGINTKLKVKRNGILKEQIPIINGRK